MNFKSILSLSLLTAALTLTACGAKKTSSGTSDLGSITSNSLLADCNTIPANSANLGGVVSSYYDQASKSYRMDLGRLFLKQVPLELSTTETHYLQIFRWRINESTGEPIYQTSPISLVFMLRSSGQILNAYAPEQSLSKNVSAKIISNYGLNAYGVTPDNFFNRVVIIATGLYSTDDAYSLALYNSDSGSTPIASVDVLMPSFTANPQAYTQTHPWPRLYNLHPFIQMPGLSDIDYWNASSQYCQMFFQ